ncbi:MAG: DUF1579 domain-containing protein [Candidatus Eisenbacteria bacterium]|nr:DUF1579 domain-containing protein [Candidatus Eisenbacteria bacterium]
MRKIKLAVLMTACLAVGAPSAEDEPCSSPEARQFDFWLGEWDLSWGEDGVGTNTVSKVLDGCVIQEDFDGGPFKGMSWSVYDPEHGMWRQTWVDNTGNTMSFTGGWVADRMILGRVIEEEGREVHQRMVFYNIAADSLEWDWEKSTDGGKTWELAWRIHYKRRDD